MSLNLGPQAFEAVISLKNNPDFGVFKEALWDQMTAMMHQAISGPVPDRADATGYARALRDLVAHIEQIEKGSRTPKPSLKGPASQYVKQGA